MIGGLVEWQAVRKCRHIEDRLSRFFRLRCRRRFALDGFDLGRGIVQRRLQLLDGFAVSLVCRVQSGR